MNYGLLFLGLAWFAWQGLTAFFVLALLALEILVTGLDEWIENKTRVLPGNERVLHMVLTLNFGLIAALVVLETKDWISLPSAVVLAPVSFLRWPITLLGIASLAWGLRDAIAYRSLPGEISLRPIGGPRGRGHGL